MEVKISLLCFASQLGRKISKLSLSESEYFRATRVRGHNILKMSRVNPSPMTRAMHPKNEKLTVSALSRSTLNH